VEPIVVDDLLTVLARLTEMNDAHEPLKADLQAALDEIR
jgi:hypothetical protein